MKTNEQVGWVVRFGLWTVGPFDQESDALRVCAIIGTTARAEPLWSWPALAVAIGESAAA